MDGFLKGVGTVIVFVLIVTVLSFIFAFPTKWAVNYVFAPSVLTTIFGGPLTVWKAWAFNYLFVSLFGKASNSSKD
jgi:hypothetical protein